MLPRLNAPGPQRVQSRQRTQRQLLGLFSGSIPYSHNLWQRLQSVHFCGLNRRKKAEAQLNKENIAPQASDFCRLKLALFGFVFTKCPVRFISHIPLL